MKVFNTSFTLATEERTEVSDITKLIREAVQQFPIENGIALINTLHTTCALLINEFQSALIDDLKGLIERLVPERGGYRHDDPRFSDCERGNAHAHLRAALIGPSESIPIIDGRLGLGTWQQVVLLDFDDRPRQRTVSVTVLS
jgi:secondary thiamine-phosphate synthase enzyme